MNRLILTSEACESLVKFKSFLKKGMRVAFITTAADPYEDKSFVENDRDKLIELGLKVVDYDMKKKNKSKLLSDLRDFNVIFVSGGNTFYLLEKMRESGFDKIIKQLLSNGIIYIGSSAGTIIAGPDIYPTYRLDNAELAPKLNGYKGFSLVNFCIFPHWGSEHFRGLYLNKRLEHAYYDKQVPLVALTDSQYVWMKDKLMEIIDVRVEAK